MAERLQKILSAAGIASRRAAEKLINDGRVTVNGTVATLGQSAEPEKDDIRVDGRGIDPCHARSYIMLNKPRGFVTTLSDEQGRRTVADLVSGFGARLYPVGRLDLDSEGLLIMTDDGSLANALMHPSHNVDKVYEATVSGCGIEEALPILRSELVIDDYKIKPAVVELAGSDGDKSILHVTIHEGRNRQVRKMCAEAGLRVHSLRRIAEGQLSLGDLPVGRWRSLTENEIAYLKNVICE